jgi:hypothetical protein
MEEGMRSSLTELSTGFILNAQSSAAADGTATISGGLSSDVDWDTVVNAPYFWDWVTGAIVPAVCAYWLACCRAPS